MSRQKRIIVVLTIMLVIAMGNFFRVTINQNIRAVDMLSIFTIGVLAGALINQVYIASKKS